MLADCPERLSRFFGADARWESAGVRDLDAADAALWRALDGRDGVYLLERKVSGARRLFARMVVVGDAPRSQYDALHAATGAGLCLEEPVACLALGGRGFHGQRGRGWAVADGNLFLTVGAAPGAPVCELVPALTAVPALAVVDAVRAAGDAQIGIKWVNDIVIDGAKVAGVLAATQVQGTQVDSVVFGVGVNVVSAPAIPPTPFVPGSGSLLGGGVSTDLPAFFWAALDALATRYTELVDGGGKEALLAAYRRESIVLGQRVRIWAEDADLGCKPATWPAPLAAGKVEAIDANLSLRLVGQPEPVGRGRLALESACQALATQVRGRQPSPPSS